ncbi:MAG: DUF2769 domain-containing protein [Candidatus Freyarchaeota archaeon]
MFFRRGKSKKITEEVSCTCPSCPVCKEMNFTKVYFCTRGTEPAAERVIIAKPSSRWPPQGEL